MTSITRGSFTKQLMLAFGEAAHARMQAKKSHVEMKTEVIWKNSSKLPENLTMSHHGANEKVAESMIEQAKKSIRKGGNGTLDMEESLKRRRDSESDAALYVTSADQAADRTGFRSLIKVGFKPEDLKFDDQRGTSYIPLGTHIYVVQVEQVTNREELLGLNNPLIDMFGKGNSAFISTFKNTISQKQDVLAKESPEEQHYYQSLDSLHLQNQSYLT